MSFTLDERCKWTQHVLQMNNIRFPKLVYKFILTTRRKVVQPRKRWEETNTHVIGKSLKMAYALLLMMTPHWFCNFPLMWYLMEMTAQMRNSDVYADCTYCIQFLLEDNLCICLTHSGWTLECPGATDSWGHKIPVACQWRTCIHKTACAIPEHYDFLTCKQGTISVYLL